MIGLDVRSNIAQVLRRVEERQKSIPVAVSNALNLTAFKVREQEIEVMKRVFDRPTRYTLGALFVLRATREAPTAKVFLKESNVGRHYLRPEIFGGARIPKGFELVLRSAGLLPKDMFAVPGSAAKIDAFGNMSRGQLSQVMSALRVAEHLSGYSANRTPESRRRRRRRIAEYFVGRPGGKLPLGVWQSMRFAQGSAVKPILIFVRRPTYSRRFAFFDVAERVAGKAFPQFFERELRGIPTGRSLSFS